MREKEEQKKENKQQIYNWILKEFFRNTREVFFFTNYTHANMKDETNYLLTEMFRHSLEICMHEMNEL